MWRGCDMSNVQMTENRGQITKRKAIIFCSTTIADCPISATCIATDEETKKKTLCGHYAGSTTDRDGSMVYCEFAE